MNTEAIAINGNHLNIVRFFSDQDEGFKKTSLILKLMLSAAVPRIANSWGQFDAEIGLGPIAIPQSTRSQSNPVGVSSHNRMEIQYPFILAESHNRRATFGGGQM